LIELLINRIENLQIKDDSKYYSMGLFPSSRSNQAIGYKREDSNIYYSALIAYTLLNVFDYFTTDQKIRVKSISDKVIENFPKYKSKRDPILYNFYKTNPSDHYPNGHFFSKFKHFELADDADDTCIITLTLQSKGGVELSQIQSIRKYLLKFSNLNRKKIKFIPPTYRELKAYGVWFGSGKMPIEFDICVIANILCFIFKNNLQLKQQDIDSLAYIRKAIKNYDIINNSFSISYMYPDSAVILYHIARLWSNMPDPEIYLPKKIIIKMLRSQLVDSDSTLERIILSTSLLKMGITVPPVKYSLCELKREFKSFGFFIAPMLKGTGSSLLNKLAELSPFQILFDCEAYYYTLVLEYELIIKHFTTKPKLH
jgi:hypothetical protein